MTFEEAKDMYMLHSISPELTCTCDELHMCQQCSEDLKNECDLNSFECQSPEQ
jgi:hypothetical protein